MKRIALLIPVFNRLDYTKQCLQILSENIKTQFFQQNEIYTIVIDDGSSDGTESWIKEHYPEVILLKGDGEQWWSGSMNLGLSHAFEELKCDFVLLWENDIFPVDHYFNHLQVIVESWDGKTVACSKVYYRSRPDIIFGMGGSFNRRSGKKFLIGRNKKDGEAYSEIREVDWFLGQGILIHRDVFLKVGGFDRENFPQYYGDMDFALRCQNAGFTNVVYPGLKLLNDTATTGISHKKNQSLKELWESLTSIRSSFNVKRDLRFYRIHSTNILAYGAVVRRFCIFLGSYFKWKILGWFGIRKKGQQLY